MTETKRLGITPLIVMAFGNKLYTDTIFGAPATPEAREAYARYGQNIMMRFPEVNLMEIWNEYNGS